jgi:hypothetical protein
MRIVALAIATMGTIAAVAPAAGQTYAPDYPICLHVHGPVSYYECHYTSLAQCNLSASGRAAECVVNPYFASAAVPLGRHYRRHRHVY